jgi:hypothetical protein
MTDSCLVRRPSWKLACPPDARVDAPTVACRGLVQACLCALTSHLPQPFPVPVRNCSHEMLNFAEFPTSLQSAVVFLDDLEIVDVAYLSKDSSDVQFRVRQPRLAADHVQMRRPRARLGPSMCFCFHE